MEHAGQPPEIFDRQRRRALQERAARCRGDAFLCRSIAEELADRLAIVSREFANALFIGPMAMHVKDVLGERQCAVTLAGVSNVDDRRLIGIDEDHLPFDPQSFDLIVSGGMLDSVNDLPGALVQIRRILKPDGLFLGHMFGASSLATLKSIMMEAEGNVASPHIHPQIELRSAADLLARAGFALPVADRHLLSVRYANWRSIVADIREAGVGNALAGGRRYLGKDVLTRLDEEWIKRADSDGRVEEHFSYLFLSGWAPAPNQPRAAARGSGQISLATVFPRPAQN